MGDVELAFERLSASQDEQPFEPDSASKVIEAGWHLTDHEDEPRFRPVCPTWSFSCEGAGLTPSNDRPP